MEFIKGIDEAIVLFVAENVRFGFLNIVMVIITSLGNVGAIWLLAGAALLISKKHRRYGLVILVCIGLCAAVNNLVLKNLIARPRPFTELAELSILIKPPSGLSFPSGHAAASFAAAVALTHCYGRRGALSFILAALIAVSRVYVGVHYPSDVLAGAAVGTICALVVCAAETRVFSSRRM